jgi:hypothetical protein
MTAVDDRIDAAEKKPALPQPVQDLTQVGIALGGLALFGFGFFLIVIGIAVWSLWTGGGWPEGAATFGLLVSGCAAALSATVIFIVTTVRFFRHSIPRTFSGWIEAYAEVAMVQNAWVFYLAVALAG